MIKKIRKYHKWLMAFVGIQFLIWSLTGLYMVSMDIHFIHGEHLRVEHRRVEHLRDASPQQTNQTLALDKVNYSLSNLLSEYPHAQNITLGHMLDKQVYRFMDHARGKVLIDADSGKRLAPLNEAQALNLAQYHFSGTAAVASAKLISDVENTPPELSPRHLPVWQITFAGFSSPTFYINQYTAEIVTTRHLAWRMFDWMWRFHIMDYDDGENVANWFLLLIALLGCVAASMGAVLTYQRICNNKQAGAK
ncbi:PepSY domain-containing protein [Pseudoalteromonas byunsanensis]|uniref:Peptidase n=1 Tax=Pseudoalteromonas byunsanensis TaxID=327939 RepID=A0A1S1N6W2_9GAMM|nr:PepSY domain-containing protein [Pseudoalteromonas byunsanensis]OHU95158.1 hypothetical protein BIW53_10550 [Pseudoalteromonas byunsanensis]